MSASSWQASNPSATTSAESTPPSWASGQGVLKNKEEKKTEEGSEPKKDPKPTELGAIVERNNSPSLLLMSMMVEGILFGSLYGWALLRVEGVKLPDTKKYLGIASVLGPLLVMDKDCCRNRVANWDVGLIAIHLMLSLRTWFERSFQSVGPWSMDKIPSDELLSVVAFITHFRCFLHLLTKEAKGSLAKKVALLAGFALGSNLTVF